MTGDQSVIKSRVARGQYPFSMPPTDIIAK